MPTKEFFTEADWILGEMFTRMNDADKEIARKTQYAVADEPNTHQLAATATPDGWKLLGMYEYEPINRVTIFEQSLQWLASKVGSTYQAIHDTLDHEKYQHVLGWDHVKETKEAGLLPAFAVPCG